jgi:hypothetical protein
MTVLVTFAVNVTGSLGRDGLADELTCTCVSAGVIFWPPVSVPEEKVKSVVAA